MLNIQSTHETRIPDSSLLSAENTLATATVGMGLSVIAMVFAAFGFISPAVGALLQEGIDVIVILNAL